MQDLFRDFVRGARGGGGGGAEQKGTILYYTKCGEMTDGCMLVTKGLVLSRMKLYIGFCKSPPENFV